MTKTFARPFKLIKSAYQFHKPSNFRYYSTNLKPPWRVLFFGSDEFSLYSLNALFKEYQNNQALLKVLNVVTCSQQNPIYKFATKNNLTVQKWPPNLSSNSYDLGVVVSFGNLIPDDIIKKFPLGMLNVHASLLPRWRGASPIVYAIAKGDSETGVTIMKINPNKFDTGNILWQEKCVLPAHTEMPELHEKLGKLGADCLVETIRNIQERLENCVHQPQDGISYAPKITPNFCKINWPTSTSIDIYNLHRALKSVMQPTTTWNSVPVKLFDIGIWNKEPRSCVQPGFVEYSRKNKALIVECAHKSWITVKRVGVQGKKVMSAADFYNGFISKIDKNKVACFVYFCGELFMDTFGEFKCCEFKKGLR